MFRSIALAAVACVAVSTAANAATTSYEATSAQSTSRATDNHSLWSSIDLDGLGRNFHFAPAGAFTLMEDGDYLGGLLEGKVLSGEDDSSGFELSFSYDNDLSAYGPAPSFKNEQGSQAIQDAVGDNFFMSLTSGVLKGFGALSGANFSVAAMPTPAANAYATQIGTGSNNKNANYGLANWFFFNAEDCTNAAVCEALDGKQGDINVDLAPVPLPAPALMLLAGLGAFAGVRRAQRA